tara:strand:- start:2560 stop:2784 length:225 start_codon:yes stop_codon:yes gene_type:complete
MEIELDNGELAHLTFEFEKLSEDLSTGYQGQWNFMPETIMYMDSDGLLMAVEDAGDLEITDHIYHQLVKEVNRA